LGWCPVARVFSAISGQLGHIGTFSFTVRIWTSPKCERRCSS
jgi:hypothetical protein